MRDLGIPVAAKWCKPNSSPECLYCYAEHNDHFRFHRSPHVWVEQYASLNVRLRPEKMREFHTVPVKPVDLPPSQRERFFVCSYGDIFHELVPDSFLKELFAAMVATPHIYMLLTKRPERAAQWPGPWPENIWLGTTCGHEITKWRIEFLRRSAAKVRFISMEPLLTPMLPLNLEGIDQVIVGGESGGKRRPFEMEWARQVRDACVDHGSAFFFKQDSDFRTERRPYLVEQDGTCWKYEQYPGELAPPVLVQAENDARHRELFPILAQ
jgi:protein gp37